MTHIIYLIIITGLIGVIVHYRTQAQISDHNANAWHDSFVKYKNKVRFELVKARSDIINREHFDRESG